MTAAFPGAALRGDVIVVGGGVIGTAIAWRAARSGLAVTLIDPVGDDPRTDDKASLVAAGMLGPVSESVFGEQDLLNLNLYAIDRFPSFNQELEEAAGKSTGLRTEGTLAVAYDSGDLAALDRLTDFRHSIGLKAERLGARECRRLEPFLAPSTRGGVLATGDLSVDNRRYLAALKAAAATAGVQTIRGTVTKVLDGQVRMTGSGQPGMPETALTARHIVIAAGHATRALDGVPDEVRAAIRPVKGQILRLRHPRNIPHILTRTVRAIVQGHDLYFVPRQDGELVVGATQEEREDRDVTVGAVHDLLRDAATAVPAVSELVFAEASAGLRPGTGDNGPILGPVGGGSRIIAAGHFRNGILLSAVTADAVTALLHGDRPHQAWVPFQPGRFLREEKGGVVSVSVTRDRVPGTIAGSAVNRAALPSEGYGPPGPGVPPGSAPGSGKSPGSTPSRREATA
jgi:glycine oxidase